MSVLRRKTRRSPRRYNPQYKRQLSFDSILKNPINSFTTIFLKSSLAPKCYLEIVFTDFWLIWDNHPIINAHCPTVWWPPNRADLFFHWSSIVSLLQKVFKPSHKLLKVWHCLSQSFCCNTNPSMYFCCKNHLADMFNPIQPIFGKIEPWQAKPAESSMFMYLD